MPESVDSLTLEEPTQAGNAGGRTPTSLDAKLVAGNLRSKLFGRPDGPTRCGRFEVRRRLGEGGMGVVYEAWDPDLERRVALKLLSETYGLTSVHRKRLVKEAQTLARLRHPNIVGVYEVGVDDGRMFVALEHIAGHTVRQWLVAEVRPWRAILQVFLAAGEGLAAAHARGLVHRDFKPDNVMVADDGSVRVLDFGLVKDDEDLLSELTLRRPKKAGSLTRTGSRLGTPLYMSPEQFHRLDVDARADQFAFCVSLYEALYGEHPFPLEGIDELQAAIVAGQVRAEPKGTAVPRWIRAVVVRGLSAEPAQRWASMTVLLEQLRCDPVKMRRRRLALAGVALGGVGLWGATYVHEQSVIAGCQTEAAGIDDVWGPQARDRAKESIDTTELPHSATTWTRLEHQLDAYAQRWRDARSQICMAAEHDEDMPAHVAAAQRACLDDRQRSLRVFVEEIEQSHGRLLGRLLTRVGELPDVAMCRDRAYVLRRYNVAALADRWPRVEAVREALAESERAYWAGDLEGSRRHADEAYRVANELQDGELRARALFWQAMFDLRRGANNESRDRLIEGLLAALRAGADDVARHCATGATAAASEGGKLELAELLGGVALALDDRLDGQGTDGYRTLGVLARVYESQGRMDEALRAGEESHRWAQRQLSEDDPHLGVSHENLGGMYHRSGRFEEALRHTRAAIEIARRTEGEHSAAYVWARVAYAGTLGYLGEHAAAEDVVLDAKRLLEEAGRTQTGQYSYVLADLAELARWQGRPREAREVAWEAVRVCEAIDGPSTTELTFKLAQLGLAELELGHHEAALGHLERAMQGEHTESRRNRAELRWALSRTLTALGREPEHAAELADEAVEHCTAAGRGHSSLCTQVRAWRDELAAVEQRP